MAMPRLIFTSINHNFPYDCFSPWENYKLACMNIVYPGQPVDMLLTEAGRKLPSSCVDCDKTDQMDMLIFSYCIQKYQLVHFLMHGLFAYVHSFIIIVVKQS